MKEGNPLAVVAASTPMRVKKSVYPEPFASMMEGREKHPLGDLFGIKHFGVNLTRLAPGARSALLHRHQIQEEFIYILEGNPILVTDINEVQLHAGMCAGFISSGPAHCLINRSDQNVVYLEIGGRTAGDAVSYPADDLVAVAGDDGKWHFTHKNGDAY